jgi:hypothetical protein
MTLPDGVVAAPPEYTAIDESNHLLAVVPAVLSLKRIPTPLGMLLTHTIRTPSGTQTVFLEKAEAEAWAASILRETSQMSDSGLAVADGPLPRG